MYSWVGAYVSETTRCILVWLFTHVTSNIVVELYGIRHYTIGIVVTCSLMEEISLDIFSVPMWRNNRCYPPLMFLIDLQNGRDSRCIQPFMEISLKCKVLMTNEFTSELPGMPFQIVPKMYTLFSVPIFWLWTYLMKVIPESRCATKLDIYILILITLLCLVIENVCRVCSKDKRKGKTRLTVGLTITAR